MIDGTRTITGSDSSRERRRWNNRFYHHYAIAISSRGKQTRPPVRSHAFMLSDGTYFFDRSAAGSADFYNYDAWLDPALTMPPRVTDAYAFIYGEPMGAGASTQPLITSALGCARGSVLQMGERYYDQCARFLSSDRQARVPTRGSDPYIMRR